MSLRTTPRPIPTRSIRDEVNKAANVLKKLGVKKGDRVAIYLPMIPELAIVMTACTRIGAIHSIVFGGFSSDALKDRINDCNAHVLITADGYYRGGKTITQKKLADAAVEKASSVKKVLVIKRTGAEIEWTNSRDVWYHEMMKDASPECEPSGSMLRTHYTFSTPAVPPASQRVSSTL